MEKSPDAQIVWTSAVNSATHPRDAPQRERKNENCVWSQPTKREFSGPTLRAPTFWPSSLEPTTTTTHSCWVENSLGKNGFGQIKMAKYGFKPPFPIHLLHFQFVPWVEAWNASVLRGCWLSLRQVSRRSTSVGVVTLGGGVLKMLGKETAEGRAVELGERTVFSTHVGYASLEIQIDLEDLGCKCSVTVGTDSRNVIDHAQRWSHSVASKHVGLRCLLLQEPIAEKKLTLEKVHTAANLARRVYQSVSWGQDPRAVPTRPRVHVSRRKLKWAPILCAGLCLSWIGRADPSVPGSLARLGLKGRVEVTCLSSVVSLTSQSHLFQC